jgi:hypothetical protein
MACLSCPLACPACQAMPDRAAAVPHVHMARGVYVGCLTAMLVQLLHADMYAAAAGGSNSRLSCQQLQHRCVMNAAEVALSALSTALLCTFLALWLYYIWRAVQALHRWAYDTHRVANIAVRVQARAPGVVAQGFGRGAAMACFVQAGTQAHASVPRLP